MKFVTILFFFAALNLYAQNTPTNIVVELIQPIIEPVLPKPAAPVVDSAPAEPAAPQPFPAITVTTQTVTTVDPITLSPEQMSGIIAAVQAGGISASVPITSSNLSSVYLYEQDGHFIVNIKLK